MHIYTHTHTIYIYDSNVLLDESHSLIHCSSVGTLMTLQSCQRFASLTTKLAHIIIGVT